MHCCLNESSLQAYLENGSLCAVGLVCRATYVGVTSLNKGG